MELSQVFERTLGHDSDIVGKELYSFIDSGNNKLTMRPEATAGKNNSQRIRFPTKFPEVHMMKMILLGFE